MRAKIGRWYIHESGDRLFTKSVTYYDYVYSDGRIEKDKFYSFESWTPGLYRWRLDNNLNIDELFKKYGIEV